MTKAPVQNHRHGHRDASIDALLRQTLRSGAGEAVGPCLDADLLAAWADRSLPEVEATSVEHHVAGCARCQAIAASLARASAPLVEAAPSFWKRWQLSWLVPVAAAAVLAIWVALPDRGAGPVLESVDSRLSSPAAPDLEAQAKAASSEPPAEQAFRPERAAPSEQFERRIVTPRMTGNADTAEQADVTRPNTGATEGATGARQETATAGASRERTDPAAGGGGRPAAKAEASPATLNESIAAASPTPAPAPAAAPSAPTSAAAADAAAPPVPPGLGGQNVGQLTRARVGSTADALTIVAPGSPQRWRVVAGRRIERSIDGGASWIVVAPEAPAVLTAGASPGAGVCWFVGRGGTIVASTDGAAFTRVTSPSPRDLVAIRAEDGRTAVVVDADGRAFRTTDRGATWSTAPR